MSLISSILARRSKDNGDKLTVDRAGNGTSSARASMLSIWDGSHVYVPFDAANTRGMGERSTAQGTRDIGAGARFFCVAEWTGKPCSRGKAHETTCSIDPTRFGGASPNEFYAYGVGNGGGHAHLLDAVREMSRSTTLVYKARRLMHWADLDYATQAELVREYAPAAYAAHAAAAAPKQPAIEAPKQPASNGAVIEAPKQPAKK